MIVPKNKNKIFKISKGPQQNDTTLTVLIKQILAT